MTTEFAKVQNYFSIARFPHGAVDLITKLHGARAARLRAAMYATRLTSLIATIKMSAKLERIFEFARRSVAEQRSLEFAQKRDMYLSEELLFFFFSSETNGTREKKTSVFF